MGCTDRKSNFQAETFRNGRWWCSVSFTPGWEGPIEELTSKFPNYAEPQFIEGSRVYSAEQLGDGAAIVKPIGRVALDSTSV